ncbi:MAG: ShlB/FhaC/HecB family hemolysin secretion/activation protein [Gammaproteobacteria bacterium]|nr:ShlB/FhaC/HecB family hemolysin secretion/activation protein [Gammaproteobacteria bacterium]
MNNKVISVVIGVHLSLWQIVSVAGLLEIPNIIDSTSLKGKSVFENTDIPAVTERDPNPESGQRIWVKEIKVQGIVERPEYGIIKKDIDAFVEKLRQEAMRENELLKYGYSLEELAEIAELMLEIDAANNLGQVTEPDVQKLIWLVRQQKERRGLTLGNLEEIADKLTNYYRERGFFLTNVYIPKQEVRDAIVGLTVLEGKLGDVTVSGNERYDSNLIVQSFDELKYQPVTEKEIEQKLYLLNDFPGLELYGYFKAGDQIGDTRLNLEVRQESLWSASVRLDNHGSELTGQERIYSQFQWNNPLKIADKVIFGVMQSVQPDNATYGVFRYRAPVYSEAYHVGFNYSQNQFAIGDSRTEDGLSFLGLEGETAITELLFDYSLIRRRENNWLLSFQIADKESDLSSDVLTQISDDKVLTYKFSMNYDVLNEISRTLNEVNVSLATGDVKQEAQGIEQDNEFNIFNLNYSSLIFTQIPGMNINARIIFKLQFQYTDAVLPPVEQFSLAGPNVVRAFSVTEFPADSAIYLGNDWVFNLPSFANYTVGANIQLSRILHPFLFVDYAYGVLNPVGNEGDKTGVLAGYGIGLQLNYKNKISGNLQFAIPISSDFSDENQEEPDDDLRIVADFLYVFN